MEKVEFRIPGAWVKSIPEFSDNRGILMTLHNKDVDFKVKEIYSAATYRGYLRGLHFQCPPYPQNKIIYCAGGMIQDVIVDLRKGSPTYGESFEWFLDEAGSYLFHIPAGCAHGYYAYQNSKVLYFMDESFHKDCYGGIHWNSIRTNWPDGVKVSDKDSKLPELVNFDSPFIYGVNC